MKCFPTGDKKAYCNHVIVSLKSLLTHTDLYWFPLCFKLVKSGKRRPSVDRRRLQVYTFIGRDTFHLHTADALPKILSFDSLLHLVVAEQPGGWGEGKRRANRAGTLSEGALLGDGVEGSEVEHFMCVCVCFCACVCGGEKTEGKKKEKLKYEHAYHGLQEKVIHTIGK